MGTPVTGSELSLGREPSGDCSLLGMICSVALQPAALHPSTFWECLVESLSVPPCLFPACSPLGAPIGNHGAGTRRVSPAELGIPSCQHSCSISV